MWDFLLENVRAADRDPERSEGPYLLRIMVRGKPLELWNEWIDWEDALWNSRPELGYDSDWWDDIHEDIPW